jgi:hypothetical protein
MKKALFSTTALAAAGALAFVASDAVAQTKAKPLAISVGGYFNSFMGYAEQSGSFESTASSTARAGYDQFNIVNDSEIYFRGATKLDNGIGVSVTVQLESDQVNNAAAHIDESYMTVSGGFGSVLLGSTKGATVKKFVGAPGVGGLGLGNTDHDSWIIKPSAVGNTVNFSSGTTAGASDAMKIVYLSPKIGGAFEVGASYTPSTTNADNMPVTGGTLGTEAQMYDGVVKFSSKMGGATVNANVGYGETHGIANSSIKFVRTGATVASGGATLGFGYKDVTDIDSGKGGTANSDEQTSYNMGVKYAAGGYTVGVAYSHTEMPMASGTQGEDEMDKYVLGVEHGMGAGVTLTGQLAYVDWSDELTSDANNNNGWALVGGIKVAF